MMQSFNLNNVQNYFSSYIHLLLQLHNSCRYDYFNLGFGSNLFVFADFSQFERQKQNLQIHNATK
jgi:hypothetical protein